MLFQAVPKHSHLLVHSKSPKIAETKLSSSPYLGIPSFSMPSKKELLMKHNVCHPRRSSWWNITYTLLMVKLFSKSRTKGVMDWGMISCHLVWYFVVRDVTFLASLPIIWCIMKFLWCGRPKKNAYFGGKHMIPRLLMWTFSQSIMVICKANPSFVFMDPSLASSLEHSSIKAMD